MMNELIVCINDKMGIELLSVCIYFDLYYLKNNYNPLFNKKIEFTYSISIFQASKIFIY